MVLWIHRRVDLSEGLRKLQCRTLIFIGENSAYHSEAVHMTTKLDRRYGALVEVQGSGSLVTEEQPQAMVIPMEYFLMGYGLYRPTQSVSPRSPLSPTRISPELLSPENMGLKLKPIKTRLALWHSASSSCAIEIIANIYIHYVKMDIGFEFEMLLCYDWSCRYRQGYRDVLCFFENFCGSCCLFCLYILLNKLFMENIHYIQKIYLLIFNRFFIS